MRDDRLLDLLDAHLEGRLTSAEADELRYALRCSPQARELYWAYVEQHALLEDVLAEARGADLAFGRREELVFLGREIATHRDYSEETARLIDQEVKSIVANAFERAVEILTDNEDALHRLADSLLEREILDNEEIRLVIAGEELAPEPPGEDPAVKKRKTGRGAGAADHEGGDEELGEGRDERDEGRVPADSTARASRLAPRPASDAGPAAE